MKTLFFTYDLPYPLDAGGKIRAFNLLKNLAKKHDITLFSFYRRQNQLAYLPKLEKITKKICYFPRRKVASWRNFRFWPLLPFPAALYWDPKVKQVLEKEINKNKFDLIHLESFYTSGYLDPKIKIPQVLGTENIEWRIYKDYAERQKNYFVKKLLQTEIKRIKDYESKTWQKADKVLAVSAENAQEIKKETGRETAFIPNGIDLDYYKIDQSDYQTNVLFVGNLAYLQNQDAVSWILNDIWPKLKKNLFSEKKVSLIIAGKNAKFFLRNFRLDERVKIIDNIGNINEIYKQGSVVLAPIRIGSGTKFKVLEGMAKALPVVTTSLGAEGISQELRWGLIADTAEQIVAAILKLIKDEKIRSMLGRNGRQIIEKYFSWPEISRDLEKVYEETVNHYH